MYQFGTFSRNSCFFARQVWLCFHTLLCLSMYFVGTRTEQPDIMCWIVLYFACTLSRYHILSFCGCTFYILCRNGGVLLFAHMLLSADLLSVEDFNHTRLHIFCRCVACLWLRNRLCTFFSSMVLIFCFERFVLMVVFSCCFVDSNGTFESIWSSCKYVRAFQ